MNRSETQVIVTGGHSLCRGRVIRYRKDQVGNDLTAVLRWCFTHNEPVWVYDDESYECPHTRIVEVDTRDHVIGPAPWEDR